MPGAGRRYAASGSGRRCAAFGLGDGGSLPYLVLAAPDDWEPGFICRHGLTGGDLT